MKILMLMGGNSSEREISLKSGDNVKQALVALGHSVITGDPADQSFRLSELTKDVDVVFPILHGEGGEDGVLQEELEALDVPYLGSDSKSSKLAFNKLDHKRLLKNNGILTPKFEVVSAADFDNSDLASNPYVIKPIGGGSSIDTFIVTDPSSEPAGLRDALAQHGEMLIEEMIKGDELTVGVLGDESLPVILIVPPAGELFDYENKYNGRSQEIVSPEQVAPDAQLRAQKLALQVHKLTGCRHFSRTDIMLAADGQQYVLEINTIPGLTAESLLPKAAAGAGYNMQQLAARLLELAVSKP